MNSSSVIAALWPNPPDNCIIAGVDFSSSPTPKKPIRIACAQWAVHNNNRVLQVTDVLSLNTHSVFLDWLINTPRWVGGFDMPFGLSRHLVDTLSWPGANRYDVSTWNDFVRFYTQLSRDQIKQCFQAWCNAHPSGHKFAHRASDIPAKSSPSMKWVNPPVAFMLHAGSQALIDCNASIPGCRQGHPTRVALEAYPGWLARQLIGSLSYKTDDTAKQTQARADARDQLCNHLLHEPVLGIQLQVTADIEQHMRSDPKGDCVDAVLCAVQAAWAHEQAQHDSYWGMPPDTDPLEGWITAVPFDNNSPRRHRPMFQPIDVTLQAMGDAAIVKVCS